MKNSRRGKMHERTTGGIAQIVHSRADSLYDEKIY